MLTPTLISGGVKESMVPESAKASLDIRTLPDHDHEKIIGDIRGLARRGEDNRASLNVRVVTDVPGALSSPSDEGVQTMREVVKDV